MAKVGTNLKLPTGDVSSCKGKKKKKRSNAIRYPRPVLEK